MATTQDGLEIVSYDDVDDYMAMVAASVQDGPIGVDKFWRAKFLLPLLEKRPALRPRLGSAAVDEARKFKDQEEQALMRAASRLNDESMGLSLAHLGDGLSERKMVGLVGDIQLSLGADVAFEHLICFGLGCSEPHHKSGAATLRPGDSAIFDVFAPVNRYWCDMTRTVFYQSASDEQKRVYELVRGANQAGIDAVRPGVPLAEIDRAARKFIEDGGYGPYFTHRLGHGIGLACHEPPDVSSVSTDVAAPGMCFSIEPGVYLPGKWGVRVEDLVIVTEDGCEVLNAYDKSLQILD